MDFKSVATDLEKESKGVWETYPGTDGEFLIARIRNQNFEDFALKLSEPHRQKARSGKLRESRARYIIAPAVAKHILLGWRKVQLDGKDVKYSPEKAMEFLQDKQYRDFYEWVLKIANDGENYKHELDEESEGN